ncbi:MAG: tyrosine--tRNA ligase, partial [Planctomycetaceae bacterium]|nr:tyrosine--tRNA ligase [Planctomycetaceae bacterium]
RARLTAEQVESNARDYLKQVGRVINLNEAEVHRNGDWFSQMDFARILELCSKVTIAQLLVRDDFSKRFKAEKPIYLHECLYPLMQGWDSVEIEADVELGGTEQLYTFMLARDLQRERGLPLQVGVMSPILVGTDGTKRMGKSLGNYIGIAESPFEMTKKFMQLPDDVMRSYFELLTDLPLDQVDQILAGHPKAAKQELARQIMRQYSSEAEANEAIERWEKEIGSGGGLPAEIPVVHLASALIENGTVNAVDLLCHLNLVNTKSEARRLIQQGGAKLGPEKQPIGDIADAIQVASGLIVWAGKKKFCQIEIA